MIEKRRARTQSIHWSIFVVVVLVSHLCPAVCISMDCSLLDSSVHGILQSRILEWIAIPFSRGFSRPWDWTWVSLIAVRFFTVWAIREYLYKGPNIVTVASWSAYRFLKRQVSWSHLFKKFWQFVVVIHTLKGFGVVKSKSRCFSETLLLFWWSSGGFQFDLWFLCLF